MDLFVKYLQEMIKENYAKGGRFVPADKVKPKILNTALKTYASGCSLEKSLQCAILVVSDMGLLAIF